jgi:hypothetical protein
VRANRWSAWSVLAISASILGALAAVTGWYRLYDEGSLAYGLLGGIGSLALVGGVWLRWRLGQEPPHGFRPTEECAGEQESGLNLAGRVALEMLAVVWGRSQGKGSADRSQRPELVFVAAVLLALGVPLLIVALSSRLTLDSWLDLSICLVLGVLAVYFAVIGLFVPGSALEGDPGLRKLLSDVGINSILALRLVGLLTASALAATALAFWAT